MKHANTQHSPDWIEITDSSREKISSAMFVLFLLAGIGMAVLSAWMETMFFASFLGATGVAFVILAETTKALVVLFGNDYKNPDSYRAKFLRSVGTVLILGLFSLSLMSSFALVSGSLHAPNAQQARSQEMNAIGDEFDRRTEGIERRFQDQREHLQNEMAQERRSGIGNRYSALSEQLERLNEDERRQIAALEQERTAVTGQIRSKTYEGTREGENTYMYALREMLGDRISNQMLNLILALIISIIIEAAIYKIFGHMKDYLVKRGQPQEDGEQNTVASTSSPLRPTGSHPPVGPVPTTQHEQLGALIAAISQNNPEAAAKLAEKYLDKERQIEIERIKTGFDQHNLREQEAAAKQKAEAEAQAKLNAAQEAKAAEEQAIEREAFLKRLRSQEHLNTVAEVNQAVSQMAAEVQAREDLSAVEKEALLQSVHEEGQVLIESLRSSLNGEEVFHV